jgi:hypothetical protein
VSAEFEIRKQQTVSRKFNAQSSLMPMNGMYCEQDRMVSRPFPVVRWLKEIHHEFGKISQTIA